MKYIVKIPIYKYNTGRADNGNTILNHYVNSKTEGEEICNRLNIIFNGEDKENLSKEDSNFLNEILDWEGFMIKEAYLIMQSETIV